MDDTPAASTLPAFTCVTCGGQGDWHPGHQELVCRSCGTAISAPPIASGPVEGFPLLPRLRDRVDSGREWQPVVTHLRCRACHAVVTYEAHVAGGNCDACGAPALVPCDATGAPVVPSGVLPFSITEQDARARASEWLTSQRLLRSRRRRPALDTVRAVYLPCWTFSAQVHCAYRGEIQRTRKGETRTVAIDGVVEREFDDYLVPASRTLSSRLVESIEPYSLSNLRAYDVRYLAGSKVEVYAVNMWDAWDIASARMQGELDTALKSSSKVNPAALETWPKWSGERCKHILLPAYAMTYQHRRGPYEIIVNGSTGKASGTSPRDLLVEVLTMAILLSIVAGLVYGLVWLVRALY